MNGAHPKCRNCLGRGWFGRGGGDDKRRPCDDCGGVGYRIPIHTAQAALAAEARRLATHGLSQCAIARALDINATQLRRLLAAYGDEAARLHSQAWQR